MGNTKAGSNTKHGDGELQNKTAHTKQETQNHDTELYCDLCTLFFLFHFKIRVPALAPSLWGILADSGLGLNSSGHQGCFCSAWACPEVSSGFKVPIDGVTGGCLLLLPLLLKLGREQG